MAGTRGIVENRSLLGGRALHFWPHTAMSVQGAELSFNGGRRRKKTAQSKLEGAKFSLIHRVVTTRVTPCLGGEKVTR